jgi:hypothetical protein
MRPQHAGPSKKNAQRKKVERAARQANLGNTVSTLNDQPEEAGQREETPTSSTQAPIVEPDVQAVPVSVIHETCAASPPQEVSAASSAPPLGSSTDEGHPAPPEPQSPSQLASTGGDHKAEGASEGEIAVSGEALNPQSAPPQIVQSDETVPPQVAPSDETVLPQLVPSGETVPLWDYQSQGNTQDNEPAAVQGQAAEVRFADLLDAGCVHPSEQGCLDVEANEELDTGATFSVPMVEDQVEFEFEPQLPITTFDPPFAWQTLPYGKDNEDQSDIILDDIVPECAEDATMEAAEPDSREVAMAAQIVQPLPWIPLSGFCPPTILPCPGAEEATAFVDTRVPIFEPLVLDGHDAPNSMVSQGFPYPQAAPLQSNASLWVPDQAQSSPLMAKIEPPTYTAPIISSAPTVSVPGAPVSQTAFCPQSSPSPSRAASTLASLSTCIHLGKRKRETEDREGETKFRLETGAGIPWQDVTAKLCCHLRHTYWFDLLRFFTVQRGEKLSTLQVMWLMWCEGNHDLHQKDLVPLPFCSGTSGRAIFLLPLHPHRSNAVNTKAKEVKMLIVAISGTSYHYLISTLPTHSSSSGEPQNTSTAIQTIARPPTPTPPLPSPTLHAAVFKSDPPVPACVASVKRKFVDAKSTPHVSINPRRTVADIPCVLHLNMILIRH